MYADPRTDQIAVSMAAEAMEAIAHGRVRHGADHYRERDRVLRERVPLWVEHAGKDAADKAVRALHFVSPDECLTARERTVLRDRAKADAIAEWVRVTGKPLSWYNRAWFALFGMALL